MSGGTPEAIWNVLTDRIGDDLRAVIRYGPTESESKLRPDVRRRYSTDALRDLVDRTIVAQLGHRRAQQTVAAGDLTAVVRVFEDAWIVSCPDPADRKCGVLLSIDRDGDQTTMADLEWCLGYVEQEVVGATT
ncbi:hypothetical protein [Natrarchaeobaculum aegyptiacum]|uniref:Uncharacterized protein n=1 Tax=Natrarchaeobaculum aegyptiacum TaxID=745377 RepID=A0A2Z2HPW1_9EURY|nr:hypothetical protein [Natrarchaeobaculum aegyptiacum]ARS89100.1 hypothetical protein B1756_04550 [Natrarchaeobaculum aegyptiacum]